jgi:hypothetical protein
VSEPNGDGVAEDAMAMAVYVFQFPEFINEAKLGEDFLAKIMERHNPQLQRHMEWDNRIKGLYKLNMFVLVPADLYDIIKDHPWGNGGNSWAGFRGGPNATAWGIMNYHSPAVNLPGGLNEEVGGYEKQSSDKYYSASEPSLNLEFKWNSADTVTVTTPKKGKCTVPEVCYALNVHVKQVKAELVQGKLYDY